MDWNILKVFLSIANSGSLAGAAKDLKVNHSTIFRRLRTFEESIQGKVFERINNRYELTQLGQVVLEQAQQIAASFADLDRTVIGKDIEPKGVVKITAPNNIVYRYLSSSLVQFNSDYPEIRIDILVSNQMVNMSNRQADIAVRATPTPPEHLIGKLLTSFNWSIYASDHYQKTHSLPKNIKQLAGHPLIGATGALQELAAFRWLEQRFSDAIITRADDLTGMSYLAQSQQGLALLPDDQARSGITKLFSISEIAPSDIWLLTHPDLRNVTRVKLVMQHISTMFEPHSKTH
jgi:DNA-binding transcriptional LysR family regulator